MPICLMQDLANYGGDGQQMHPEMAITKLPALTTNDFDL